MIAQKPDLVVVDRNDVPLLAVVVDNRKNLNSDKAVEFRRDVLPDLGGAYTPYFMLVSQDAAYLWANNKETPLGDPPTEHVAMGDILRNYASNGTTNGRLTRGMLELLVERWLNGLIVGQPVSGPFLPESLRPMIRQAVGGDIRRGPER